MCTKITKGNIIYMIVQEPILVDAEYCATRLINMINTKCLSYKKAPNVLYKTDIVSVTPKRT